MTIIDTTNAYSIADSFENADLSISEEDLMGLIDNMQAVESTDARDARRDPNFFNLTADILNTGYGISD